MTDKASFSEIANALDELGFSSQDFGNAELLADRLRRNGFNPDSADYAIIRMRRRAELIEAGSVLCNRAARIESLVRMLVFEDPPPWRAIAAVIVSLVRTRIQRSRHVPPSIPGYRPDPVRPQA